MKKFLMVVEITGTHVAGVVSVAQRSSRKVSAVFVKALEENTDAAVVAALKEMKSAFPKAPRSVVLVVPRSNVLVKRFEFPATTSQEIRGMLNLQITGQVPYSRDEIIYDYLLTPSKENGFSSVLTVVLPKDLAGRYLDVMEKAGLYASRFVESSQGLAAFYRLKTRSSGSGDDVVCLIHYAGCQIDVCFIQAGGLLYSRSFKAGQGDTEPASLRVLVEQIGLTLGAYRKENLGPAVERFVILSNEEISALAGKLEENYNCPVGVIRPDEAVPAGRKKGAEGRHLYPGASLAPCLGFALAAKETPFNLIPQEVIDTKRSKVHRKVLLHFLFWAVLNFILGAACLGLENFRMAQSLAGLKDQLHTLKQKGDDARRSIGAVDVLIRQMHNRIFFADILKELYRLAPEGLTFRSIGLKDMESVTLQGYATDGVSVNAFQQDMIQSPLFTDVNLVYATKRRKYKMEYTDFKITCRLAVLPESE